MTGIVIVGVGIGFIIAALTFLLLFRKAKDRESKWHLRITLFVSLLAGIAGGVAFSWLQFLKLTVSEHDIQTFAQERACHREQLESRFKNAEQSLDPVTHSDLLRVEIQCEKAEEASTVAEKAEAQARAIKGTNAKTASKEEASMANQEE